MTTFFPSTGAEADWNAAYYRLEDYFRALRVVNKLHQSQVILRILEAAAARHALDDSQSPTALAMQEARSQLNEWFQAILGRRERIDVLGVLSFLAVDAPVRWPTAFLSDEVPAELRREMQESELRAGPDLQVSSMVPRPIDVNLLERTHLPAALEKARLTLTLFAMGLIAAISLSLYFILN